MSNQTVSQWELFELDLPTGATYSNPFLDVHVTASFTNGTTTHTVDGFYDGEADGSQIWRVRFAPMLLGEWRYITSSDEPDLDGVSGTVTCISPTRAGGLTVSHQFPNWFFRSDGSAQFIVNDGWTPHPGSKYGIEEYGAQIFTYPTEAQFRTFVDVLSRNRVNMVIDLKQLYARQATCTDESFLWPWKVVDPETHRIDRDRFSLPYFQRLDRQIAWARDRNVFYGVEVLYDNSTFRKQEWANHPYNKSNGGWIPDWDAPTDEYTTDQLPFGWGIRRILDLKNAVHMAYLSRMVSYMVARTSAYWNVFYAMGCETSNIYPGQAHRVDEWYSWWGDYMARKDPHGRLLTIGDVGSRDGVPWHELNDNSAFVYGNARNNLITTQEHTYTDDISDYSDAIHKFGQRFWRFRRPTVIGEQDGRNNNKYLKERRGYWTAFVSGFMFGRIDRHYQLADGDRLGESALFGFEGAPAIYTYLAHLRAFVEDGGVSFWRMAPADEVFTQRSRSVYCLAEPGREYVIYFAAGGSATLELPVGRYRVRWYDPRIGRFHSQEEIDVAAPAVDATAETVGGTSSGDGAEAGVGALSADALDAAAFDSGCGIAPFPAPDDEDWALHIQRVVGAESSRRVAPPKETS